MLMGENMKRFKNKIFKIIILIFVFLIISFFVWASSYSNATEKAKSYLYSNSEVEVKIEQNFINPGIDLQMLYIFSPVNKKTDTGLIIYPGGKVDPKAYSTIAFMLAEKGIETIIVPMPFNFAIFGINRARKVIEGYSNIENWFIAGHSLGGVAASSFTEKNFKMIDGLILWASYPANSNDISNTNLPVLSIYGELDGLSTPDKIEKTKNLLPDSTIYYEIVGGNHAGFGDYGEQNGDNPADISLEDQHEKIVEVTSNFINESISNK